MTRAGPSTRAVTSHQTRGRARINTTQDSVAADASVNPPHRVINRITVPATAAAALFVAVSVMLLLDDGPARPLSLLLLLLFAVVVIGMIDSLQRARNVAERRSDAAEQAQRRLSAEIDARRRMDSAWLHLLRSNLFGVGVAAPDGRWMEANPALLEMFGLTFADIDEGRAHWSDHIDLDDAMRRAEEHGLNQDGASGPIEADFIRADGTAGTALLHLMSPEGTRSTMVLAVDITSRRQAERAQRASEARFRLLVDSVADHAIIMLGPDGRVMSWNTGAERLLGYMAEEVHGRHASVFHTTDDQNAGRPAALLSAAVQAGRHEDEGWRVRKDGSHVWTNIVVAPIYSDGELTGFAVVMRDLSERHSADVLLTSIMDAAIDGIIGIDEYGTIHSFNGAAERMFGYPAQDVLGSNISSLLPEPYRSNFSEYLGRYANAGPRIGRGRQLVGLHAAGTTFPLELAVSEFMIDGKRYFTGVVRDITGQRALEEQLQQAQKMHAIGQLAGGIAHDFNNLLTIIAGHTELLLGQNAEASPLRDALSEVRDACMRAAGLTRQLLAFSRRAVLEPKVLDLNEVVRDTQKMLHRIIGEDIEIVTNLPSRLRKVSVDQGQISQVLINLVVNARDAIADGGTIEVETRNCDIEQGHDLHPEARPGRCVMLVVRDNGVGMPTEIVERIFEPFFTTKQAGAGTGLGLSMVYGIVKQSGGHVEVSSELGHGTEFRVVLPAADARRAASRSRRIADDTLTGTETLLIVEDEESVRRLAVLALRAHGYRILEAANGAEALRVVASHDGDIHLIVTDVVMPVMGGRQFVEALKPMRDNLPVLYVSGYTDDAVIRHGVQRNEVAFLQKPYTPLDLARKVRNVIDGKD